MTRNKAPLRNIRPLYEKKETEFLNDMILGGLFYLRDDGHSEINYEQVLDHIGNLGQSTYAPEWKNYWKYWKAKIQKEDNRETRETIFLSCIEDIRAKGFLVGMKTIGLTGNFSAKIRTILSRFD